ncbi:uncharacterized protein [Palaemon carinicauda]|uniref:uncharacterized protein isoform X2 n=1 Tax=Palaemon carinicauda TaxID=392227 RepID=UPI0035B5B49D
MESFEAALHVAQNSEDFDEVQMRLQKYLPESSMDCIQSLSVFWDVSLEEEHTIVKLLKSIRNFNWTQPVFFYATPMVVLEKLQMLASKGLIGNGLLKPHTLFPSHFYSMISQPELEPSLPDGLELRELDEEHGEFMHSQWEYKFSETVSSYKCYLKVFPGVGVFRKSEDYNDFGDSQRSKENQQAQEEENLTPDGANDSIHTPVAWSHISPFNVFTNAYTLPEYRGQKLALSVTIALAKMSIEKTGSASAVINNGNHASIKLHERAGFRKQHAMGYQYFKSAVNTCFFDSLEPFA